ncbi:MAG TPA: hypothetical protein VMV33_17240 [Rhodocyclaceae bacterium]|nr:hypothetical protein [Rhodocyclaceae bacterium]
MAEPSGKTGTFTQDHVDLLPPIDWLARHRLGPDPEGRPAAVRRLWAEFRQQHQITEEEAERLLLRREGVG